MMAFAQQYESLHEIGMAESRGAKERPSANNVPFPISATPFNASIVPASIPRRAWVYGYHYIRKFISATFAPGGIGKTSLGTVEAMAIATGRNLLGVMPDERANVWMWNGEDPQEELDRRIVAAMIHYKIRPEELQGRLFVDTGRKMTICIAVQGKGGAVIQRPVVDAIVKAIQANSIGVLIIDPFVSSHQVTENDNNAIEMVAAEWATVADVTGCAVELVHHVRKTGGAEVGVEDGRGASALLAKARSARALNGMSEEEAKRDGIEGRRAYFRSGNGKANLRLASDNADWFQMVSVDLGNAEPGRSDSVGVATAWTRPDAFADVTVSHLRAAQKAVAAGGHWRENCQAGDWVGKPIAQALKLDPTNKAHIRKITGLLKIWIDAGMFARVPGKDSKRMDRTFVEVGQWASD